MKLLKSFLYAGKGIKYCFKHEQNFKIHSLATIVVTAMGFFFSINVTEWLFVIGCCTLVLAMEMMNTAVEKICNHITEDFHPLIKYIKDVAAGAVLICATGSALTGAIIFIPKIIHQLKIVQW
jgi:diacylglycerol kinase